MTVPVRLRRIYASAPRGEKLWQAVRLSHAEFSQAYRFTDNPQGLSVKDENGVAVTYENGPINIQVPTQDGLGRHEMPIAVAAVEEAVRAVEAASRLATSPMELRYYLYIDGELLPALDPIVLQLYAVEIDPIANTISGAASMPDLARRRFPTKVYRTATFPGLDRT